ncbi:MAG TPA: hypothetical protein VFB38_21350 [Chthonomonadaceae bacterium]|nr:hypothetical protein [Chthonomonadaceae bacterium]
MEQTRAGEIVLAAAGPASALARDVLGSVGLTVPREPEALALARGKALGRSVLLACGSELRGLVYALLEVADRVTYTEAPEAALDLRRPVLERPANAVRSIARIFSSEVEDKPWFYDRKFWEAYLSMLAAQRFNRFSLMLGMAYDFLQEVTDAYFHFAYPFLVSVPGHDVRVVGLPEGERERNLEMLRFISEAASQRGLDFHLGIWTHGYDWSRNPSVNYTIAGLTPETLPAYCRDALRTLLQGCPAIQGVVFRIHGESGIPEASYAFWQTVFDGVAQCGRRVEINLHTKGLDQALLSKALATGMPVTVAPKFWAEHLGLPYQQASIRALEMPPRDHSDQGFFAKSEGSRRFLRYGYGDLLTEDRRYGVFYRIWPGTQRLLLWGDPTFAAGYARAAAFCGSQGMELCEPLSFKGRKGSGLPGGRDAYADPALKPAGGDFEKYLYTYRLWGRLLYNPDAAPDTWRRFLKRELGASAGPSEAALSQASRILPLVTTAHLPSAANNGFWPEIYTNMPIVNEKRPHPYGDTPSPKRFGTVSALDPVLFSSIEEFADALLKGQPDGRYSPVEVAHWLEGFADRAAHHLTDAQARRGGNPSPAFRRLAVDVEIQSGLGYFFARKLRAGTLYALYRASGDPSALREAIQAYQGAREAWTQLTAQAQGVYVPDITFGRAAHLRGHWQDRLKAIEQDIADMEAEAAQPTVQASPLYTPQQIQGAVRAVLARPSRPRLSLTHTPPAPFRRGEPLVVTARCAAEESGGLRLFRLRYRRVNQAEPYRTLEMERHDDHYQAVLPGEVTDSPFPLQYFFELRRTSGPAWFYPGFNADLSNQPYFVVRQAHSFDG